MKVEVTEKKVKITELTEVFEGEFGINRCAFTLPESFEGLNVTAVFNGIPVPLIDGKCMIPPLTEGDCVLGVYAYRVNGEDTELMYSPKPTVFSVEKGSFCPVPNDVVLPGICDYEAYCYELQNYWRDIFMENTLREYKPDANEYQYYSARVINEMYQSIKGDIENVSELIGGGK